jgi:hypothetical protein
VNKDEAVKVAYTIAASVISPDHIDDLINDYKHLLPDSEQDQQLVAEALRDVQIELLEKAEDGDVMTPEEEAEIDAILDKYRGADGKVSLELVKKHSRPLSGKLLAEFESVAYDEDDDSD